MHELRNHILGRLHGREYDGEELEFDEREHFSLNILKNRGYSHSYLRCNYTTYDVRRDTDVINPSIPSRSFAMMRSAEGDHPFWYAKILKIFHVQVQYPPLGILKPRRIDILRVRWLGDDPDGTGGIQQKRLHRVGYIPEGPGAFGFIDPGSVIRGCFLVPAFKYGLTSKLLPPSAAWDVSEEGDWENYYVNM